jgi:FkbM family methyltransferase
VLLRHHPSAQGTPSNDTWTLREIFRDRPYALPAGVELPPRPRIVDLGANLGLFIAFILARFPEATVTAFEPDPDSVRLLREGLSQSPYAGQVSLHEACAMVSDGPVNFAGGGHQFSRVTHADTEAALTVSGVDVFPFLEGADLLKMDIEGAEWALLGDPRFGAARNVVMEYHPMLGPDPDPRRLVLELFAARGYRVVVDEAPMIWAVKEIKASPVGGTGIGS